MNARLKTVVILAALAILISSCGFFQKKVEKPDEDALASVITEQTAQIKPKYKIAVFLPNSTAHKWVRSAEYLAEALEQMDCEAEFFYAGDDANEQAAQMFASVKAAVDCIVIAPVDSYSEGLRYSAESAKAARIPVLAYDRLIMQTSAVDVFVAFDPYLAGRICGQYLENVMYTGSLPLTIELFMGSVKDSSAPFFYSGALDVLMPHVDAGRIKIPSGYKSFQQTSLIKPETARLIMQTRINSFYFGGTRLDAAIAADGDAAIGVIGALDNSGYGANGEFPIIVGVGGQRENIVKLAEGKQAVAIFGDERIIAKAIAETVNCLLNGVLPKNVDRTTYDNGSKIVPAVLLESVLIDKSNYRDLLIGSEYYNYTDIYQ